MFITTSKLTCSVRASQEALRRWAIKGDCGQVAAAAGALAPIDAVALAQPLGVKLFAHHLGIRLNVAVVHDLATRAAAHGGAAADGDED